jgi:hypothetical protein
MKTQQPIFGDRKFGYVLVLLTLFAILYYNLTPFVSIDGWWHMKYGEYFLENNQPVRYDPFAIQTAKKIYAPYPNLLPGILFLKIFSRASFLGLNLFRIFLYFSFIAALIFLIRKNHYFPGLLFQIIVLTFAMTGSVVLRPDLFNFLIFTFWIWGLEKLSQNPGHGKVFAGLILLELVWVNTHPLFFFYGWFIGMVYLGWMAATTRKSFSTTTKAGTRKKLLPFYFLGISTAWLLNPLGWKAFEALLVNMLNPGYNPGSVRPFAESLTALNTYGYFLIFIIFLLRKPWSLPIAKSEKFRYVVLFILLLIPALVYARCLPFPIIFIIFLQGQDKTERPQRSRMPNTVVYSVLVMAGCLLLVNERNQLLLPKAVGWVNAKLAVNIGLYYYAPGIGVNEVNPEEYCREISILNRLAEAGNCTSNNLAIASAAVWFCPDKPFFWYGHAAVINERFPELKTFFSDLAEGKSSATELFLKKYEVRTVILTHCNPLYFKYYRQFHENFVLLYMDQVTSIFVRKGSVTVRQKERIREFFGASLPRIADPPRFPDQDKNMEYLYLWFSAAMTGNDGSFYQSLARRYMAPERIRQFEKMVLPIIYSQRPGN